MHDADRRTVESFWEAFNNRDLSLLDDLFAEDYVNHATISGSGPEGCQNSVPAQNRSFGTLQVDDPGDLGAIEFAHPTGAGAVEPGAAS